MNLDRQLRKRKSGLTKQQRIRKTNSNDFPLTPLPAAPPTDHGVKLASKGARKKAAAKVRKMGAAA